MKVFCDLRFICVMLKSGPIKLATLHTVSHRTLHLNRLNWTDSRLLRTQELCTINCVTQQQHVSLQPISQPIPHTRGHCLLCPYIMCLCMCLTMNSFQFFSVLMSEHTRPINTRLRTICYALLFRSESTSGDFSQLSAHFIATWLVPYLVLASVSVFARRGLLFNHPQSTLATLLNI